MVAGIFKALFVIIAVGVFCVRATIIDYQYTTTTYDSPVNQFAKYAFLQGGVVNLQLQYELTKKVGSGGRIHFIICEEDKYEAYTQVLLLSEECGQLEMFRHCFHFASIRNSAYNFSADIEIASTYHFLIANCDRMSLSMYIHGQLLNPGPTQLDSVTQPLLMLYPVMAAIWFIFSLIYVMNSLMHQRYSQIPLHRLLTFAAFVKACVMVVCYRYWFSLASTGYETWGMKVLYILARTMWVSMLFSILLLVAKGWCITRYYLIWIEVRSISVVVIMLTTAYLLSCFGDHSFLFAYGVLFITSMKYVFSAMAYNIRSLTAQLQLVQEFELQRELHVDGHVNFLSGIIRDTQINTTPISEKLHLFKRMQMVMVTYLFFAILKLICERYFFTDLVWCMAAFEEALESLVIAIGLGFIFRIRNFRIDDDDKDKDTGSLMLPDDDTDKPSKNDPLIEQQMPPLIVIQNPPTLLGLKGKFYSGKKNPASPKIFPSVKFGTLPKFEIFKIKQEE